MSRLGQTRSPTTAELLKAAVSLGMAEMFSAIPAKVIKYDSTKQTVDAQPLVKKPYVNRDGTEGVDELPVIPNIPVGFPRGGGYFLSLPLAPGDQVLLIFCDRSLDAWYVSSGDTPVDPKDLRTHDPSDAIAIPCGYPLPRIIKDLIASGAAFGKEKGAQVRAKDSTVEITSGGLSSAVGGFVAMATLITALFNTHVHTSAAPGSPTTTPTVPWTAAQIASKNLKAD